MDISTAEQYKNLEDRRVQEANDRVAQATNRASEVKSQCQHVVEECESALNFRKDFCEDMNSRLATIDSELKHAKAKFDAQVSKAYATINKRNYLYSQESEYIAKYQSLQRVLVGYENLANNPARTDAQREDARRHAAEMRQQIAEHQQRAEAYALAASRENAKIPHLERDAQAFKETAEHCEALLRDAQTKLKEAQAAKEAAEARLAEARSQQNDKNAQADASVRDAEEYKRIQVAKAEDAKDRLNRTVAELRNYSYGY